METPSREPQISWASAMDSPPMLGIKIQAAARLSSVCSNAISPFPHPHHLRLSRWMASHFTSMTTIPYKWNVGRTTITEASGIAWTEFNCSGYSIIPIFPDWADFVLFATQFRIVETVEDPETEISVAEALLFDSSLGIGQMINIALPEDYALDTPLTALKLADDLLIDRGSIADLLVHQGDIKVKFTNLTIAVNATDGSKGTVSDGGSQLPDGKPRSGTYFLEHSWFHHLFGTLSTSRRSPRPLRRSWNSRVRSSARPTAAPVTSISARSRSHPIASIIKNCRMKRTVHGPLTIQE